MLQIRNVLIRNLVWVKRRFHIMNVAGSSPKFLSSMMDIRLGHLISIMLDNNFGDELATFIQRHLLFIDMRFLNQRLSKKRNHVKPLPAYLHGGPVMKFKNLSDVDSILLGAVENDFQLVIQKGRY